MTIGRMRETLEAVAKAHSISVQTMLSGGKTPHLVEARREAACELRRQFNLSYPAIGRCLGGMHHTTVMHMMKCKPATRKLAEWREIPCPDLSGEWAI